MNRKLLGIAVAVLALAMLASPVMALGPINAIEKNPLLSDFDDVSLEPSNHVWIAWLQDGMIKHWIPAKSTGEGIINNVAFVVDSSADLKYVAMNQNEFLGKWVYLSGEYAGGTWTSSRFPSDGSHGAVYWLFRNMNSASDAMDLAMEQPYGVYTRMHEVGWK